MLRRRPTPVVSRPLAILFALLIAAPAALVSIPFWPSDDALQAGDRAPRDLVAARDAQFESQALTERKQEEAAAAVAPVLQPVDPTVRERQQQELSALLSEVQTVRQRTDLSTQQQKLDALSELEVASSISQSGLTALLSLSNERFNALTGVAGVALGQVLNQPIQENTNVTNVVASYLASQNASDLNLTTTERDALRELLLGFVAVNTEVDEARTEEQRENARRNVDPVVVTYSRGQVVAPEGTVLTEANIEDLRETGVISTDIDFYDVGAGVGLALALGLLLAVFVYQLQPVPRPAMRRLTLIALTIAATLVAVRIVIPAVLPDTGPRYYEYMVPVAAAAMIAASFADLQFGAIVAVAVGLFSAFVVGTAPEIAGAGFVHPLDSLQVGAAFTAAGLAGASSVYGAERLSRYALAAFVIALSMAIVLGAFWLLDESRETESLGWIAMASAAQGFGSAIVTVGVFVLLSSLLGVTTRLQLMELAQSNSPLLRRLQDEAPGTYHHSMMVGALAERAAEQVGADALVTRAGAYYHDIGKLAQPGYYIENILDGQPSPHDSISPEESARRIIEHVTNGLDMARKQRLPEVIREFIPQHHGTRLVTFFYRKAISGGEQPDPVAFAYQGPRPRTKEAAIVMLADSCEALVRAGRDRSPEQIGASVDSVFAERLAEGQLDDCDITMRELQAVAASFKATLRAVYHQRIEYPAPTSGEAAATVSGAPTA